MDWHVTVPEKVTSSLSSVILGKPNRIYRSSRMANADPISYGASGWKAVVGVEKM